MIGVVKHHTSVKKETGGRKRSFGRNFGNCFGGPVPSKETEHQTPEITGASATETTRV